MQFLEQKSEQWIKPGLKFLFHFVDTAHISLLQYIFDLLYKSENTVNSQKINTFSPCLWE